MPRDLPIGNGSLLIHFDRDYQIREVYWPRVGMENHALGHLFRLGVWCEGQFRWLSDPGWQRDLRYAHSTMVTQVRLHHPDLALTLGFADAVDFHENLLVRRCTVTNHAARPREVRLFFHYDFHIMGHEVGDTAYYEPERRAVFHYKGSRWFLINGAVPSADEAAPAASRAPTGLVVGVQSWACGLKELDGREGTWRDAEDGDLSGNPIAQGSVDSTVGFSLMLESQGEQAMYCWLCVGEDFEAVTRINRLVRQRGPQLFLDRTAAYWRVWLSMHQPDLSGLPHALRHHYQMSLLAIRTQTDNGGAIIAANDSDIASAVRDTYSYVWPRDGALVAHALDLAGLIDIPRNFFTFCGRALTREGYLLHKYNPDGTLASSWHPWVRDGRKQLPIQEDETALVLWALWSHFQRFGDVEFIKPLYRQLIVPAADFLADYRDRESGMPLPSYDLWEERYGVPAFTVGAVWGGLTAAASFTESFGETERANSYRRAADALRRGADQILWQPDEGRFARMVTRRDDGGWAVDPTVDASLVGLWRFGMYAPDDPRIVQTMSAIRERLSVKTDVGGVARYENDGYHQSSQDLVRVPGNPWFICTLWLAEWLAATARGGEDLDAAMACLHWVCDHALPSGVLAEQVHPYSGAPLSVSPLTWSHAELITAVHAYLRAQARLGGNDADLPAP
ncbi:MAG TPA: glycoside hydrolase family 15 protein [Thermomicrobiaceae bacterium]|nr:glycoside hydrolase family 15 protein [Thermomicrobiaceae bacterium]